MTITNLSQFHSFFQLLLKGYILNFIPPLPSGILYKLNTGIIALFKSQLLWLKLKYIYRGRFSGGGGWGGRFTFRDSTPCRPKGSPFVLF